MIYMCLIKKRLTWVRFAGLCACSVLSILLTAAQGSALERRPAVRLAITIDDLPSHMTLPPGTTRLQIAQKMIDALKAEKIKSVYGFVNAKKVSDDPALLAVLKAWRAAGHPLGNHTYSHPRLTDSTAIYFEKDIEANEPILRSLAGETDFKYFRYPFLAEGETLEKRNAIRKYLKEKGYVVAQVTVDFEDWSWNDPYARCKTKGDLKTIDWLKTAYLQNATDALDRSILVSERLFRRPIAHVLLLHIGGFDAEMLPRLIAAYRKRGVEFVSLAEALKDKIYLQDPGLASRAGSEFEYQILKARKLRIQDVGLKPYEGYPEAALAKACL